jgi:hypothetical protein
VRNAAPDGDGADVHVTVIDVQHSSRA